MSFSSSGVIRTLCVLALCCASVAAILLCRTGAYKSDPRPNLYTSEALIDHGTITFDFYPKVLREDIGTYRLNGHYYNYFPIGTALFSLPVVGVYRLMGLHMADHEEDAQRAVIILVSLLTLCLLFRIAALFLCWWNAAAVTALFWFGTSLASTDATGLWTHDFAILWALVALHATLRAVTRGQTPPWAWIGVGLFSAYLCRPTMSLFAGALLMFVASYDVRTALKAGLLAGLLLILFMAWSFHQYGLPLPAYYSGSRLSGGQFWQALYGNLLSPARGLLIYSPFLVLVWLCRERDAGLGLKSSWLLLGLAWPVAHLLAISRFSLWWAGASYGPRLMTDVLPGLFLLTLRAWPRRIAAASGAAAVALLAAASLFAVYVNCWQGLFNPYVYTWLNEPPVDQDHLARLFDWRYPQFLYGAGMHERRMREQRPLAAAAADHVAQLRRDTATGLLAADAPLDPALDLDEVPPARFSAPAVFFQSLYVTAFGRHPSADELNYYITYAADHPAITVTHYAIWFMASPELVNGYPNSSEGDTDFIVGRFRNLLGRLPSDSELAHYRALMPADRRDESVAEARARVLAYLCVFSQWQGTGR